MGASHDSTRPMLSLDFTSPLGSTRSSASSYTISTDSAREEIYKIEAVLKKLENKKLATQRFVPSQEKVEYLSKLALSAKLDRALRRRMRGQDAVMQTRKSQPEIHMREKAIII
ncbi:hypothetical protein K3495_g2444 [Podosphaera aphanis]|nr:hypothetical protein K3495_g2444 [Podosphaera aphanis]